MTHPLFARALIVEDLDEPRQWLADLLPRALPAVQQVDLAATLLDARALMRSHAYGLALVDWGLPDGTSESLIAELVAARPGAVVIVATIHDDDTHVFPALRAGATGYILKSQPSAVVINQLQRIELGEPALSPSIALRVLRHFQVGPGSAADVARPRHHHHHPLRGQPARRAAVRGHRRTPGQTHRARSRRAAADRQGLPRPGSRASAGPDPLDRQQLRARHLSQTGHHLPRRSHAGSRPAGACGLSEAGR